MINRQVFKKGCFLLCSVLLAFGIVLISATLTIADTSIIELPGQNVEDTAFVECVNETPGNQVYPAIYTISSQRPFIIQIDYQNEELVSGNNARQNAWNFINRVFPIEVVDQLAIDERTIERWGVLPRWIFNFRNATIETPIRIVATVSINAITGAVMAFTGRRTLYPQGATLDLASAEAMTISFMQNFNFSIAPNSRYSVSNYSNMNREYYRFGFQQASESVLIDSMIGYFFIEFDRLDGGVRSFSYDWVPIEKIDIQGVVEPVVVGMTTQNLVLTHVSNDDMSNQNSIEMRLCWRTTVIQFSVPRVLVIDAFNGEILIIIDYLGGSSSKPMILAVIPSAVSFGLVAYFIGKRKIHTILQVD